MSDGRGGDTDQRTEPGRWRRVSQWLRREGRFAADTVHPESSGQTRGRRIATLVIIGLVSMSASAAGVLIGLPLLGIELRANDGAQGALDAEKGYVHAAIRPQPYKSYVPPYSGFSKTLLSQRQVAGVQRGEYADEVLANPVPAYEFHLPYDPPSYGQEYLVDLVSDSSSMLTVTDINAVNIQCGRSRMVALIDTSSDGASAIESVAYQLQGDQEPGKGIISDIDNPKWGSQYFSRKTIQLGGGADHLTLSVVGVVHPGSYCTWDLEAKFTTDDGEEHRRKLNTKPLTSDGGPAQVPGTKRLTVTAYGRIRWACQHGERPAELCQGFM